MALQCRSNAFRDCGGTPTEQLATIGAAMVESRPLMFCSSCGAQLSLGSRFCSKCGSALVTDVRADETIVGNVPADVEQETIAPPLTAPRRPTSSAPPTRATRASA